MSRPSSPRSVDSAFNPPTLHRWYRQLGAPRSLAHAFGWIRPPALGLDLGSQTARACEVRATSKLVTLPSALATDVATGSIVAVGEDARRMIGRLPAALQVHAPIQKGVIAEPAEAEFLIRQLLRRARQRRFALRPHVVIAVPTEATSVQRHALRAAAHAAGAGRVTLVRESLAAAFGAGLPIAQADASLIIEMGAEKSEVAVLSLGGIVTSRAVQVGGSDVSDAIALYLRRHHHLIVGRSTADTLKHTIGSAMEQSSSPVARASGRDVRVGRPAALEIKANELVATIRESLQPLAAALHDVLERTPPELASDLSQSGAYLSGGASRLAGLESFLAERSGIAIHRVDEPEHAVVRGCRRLAQSPELLRELASAD